MINLLIYLVFFNPQDKSKTHVEWTKAWLQTLSELQAFVKKHHTTGLVWNPKGVDAKTLANHGNTLIISLITHN